MTKLTKDELLSYGQPRKETVYYFGNTVCTKEEYELAASQPGEPLQPRCPKWFASEYLDNGKWGVVDEDNKIIIRISCGFTREQCELVAELHNAQFFSPSAPSPLPTYEEAKPYMGYAWPGFSFDGKEHEIRYVYDRMRDAMQKCRGVAELTPIETDNKATQKGEKFRIVQINKNCFKMYLFGHFIGAMASEHLAHAREKSIADNINRYIDAEVRRRLPKAVESVAPSGSAGQEPHLQPPSIRCTNCGMYGFYVRHDESLGGLVLKCVDCGEQKLIELAGRAESAAEPFGDPWGGPNSTGNEPVVSASPAPQESKMIGKDALGNGNDHFGIHERTPFCKRRGCEAETTAAQPVAANPPSVYVHWPWCNGDRRFPAGEVGHSCCCFNKWAEEFVLANPKVEEVARKVCRCIIGHSSNPKEVNDYVDAMAPEVAAILGPFFTQVSQPPTEEYKCPICRATMYMLPATIHCPICEAAPVTPVSPANFVQHQVDGNPSCHVCGHPMTTVQELGGRCRGWYECDKCGASTRPIDAAVTPVSGNGTEPDWNIIKTALANIGHACDCSETQMEQSLVCIAREAGKAQNALAGAASHNGQGWVRVEDQLPDKTEAGKWFLVATAGGIRAGIWGTANGAWGFCNYETGWHFSATHWQPLPAPPSEANEPKGEQE